LGLSAFKKMDEQMDQLRIKTLEKEILKLNGVVRQYEIMTESLFGELQDVQSHFDSYKEMNLMEVVKSRNCIKELQVRQSDYRRRSFQWKLNCILCASPTLAF
jgi:hypothetical protein